MTRARTASFGVAILTAIQPLLGAVLMLCVSLVQGVRTTLGMILNRTHRDWDTATAREDLPQATSGTQLQESHHTHGVTLALLHKEWKRATWHASPAKAGVQSCAKRSLTPTVAR